MSKFIGALTDVGIAKEAVRGTAESAATFYVRKVNFTYDDMVETVVDEGTIGVIEDATGQNVTKKRGEGEIEGNIADKSFGLLLLNLLGSVSTTGPTDSAYAHAFSVLQSSQHPSLTLFQEDPNADYKYANAMISQMEIAIELGKYARFKAGFRSKAGASATLTPSYAAENKFLPQHGVFKIASTQSGLAGASAMNIRMVRLNFQKNLEDDDAIGSTAPVDILNKKFAVEGELELVFNDETFKTQMLADTAQAMRIDLNNTDVLIGSTSTPRLLIDFYSVKFSEFKRNYGNGDIVTASVKFKAFYSLSDSKMLAVTLTNAQTSY